MPSPLFVYFILGYVRPIISLCIETEFCRITRHILCEPNTFTVPQYEPNSCGTGTSPTSSPAAHPANSITAAIHTTHIKRNSNFFIKITLKYQLPVNTLMFCSAIFPDVHTMRSVRLPPFLAAANERIACMLFFCKRRPVYGKFSLVF